MDEDQDDDFKEYTTTKPKSKCWTSFQNMVEKIITNPTYHKIFLLLVVVDTTLVYTEEWDQTTSESSEYVLCGNSWIKSRLVISKAIIKPRDFIDSRQIEMSNFVKKNIFFC